MIRFVIDNADVRESQRAGWLVEHPTNSAILAYCDTEEEAKRVRDALGRIGRALSLQPGERLARLADEIIEACGNDRRPEVTRGIVLHLLAEYGVRS